MNVRSISRRVVLATALALLSLGPVRATSYVMVSDEALVDQSDAAVVARVTGIDRSIVTAGRAGSGLYTEYELEVEETLKGDLPGRIVRMRVPGGVLPDQGIGLKVYGAPLFRAGERTLLFLQPDGRGAYRPQHLMLGAFHEVPAGDRRLAIRNLAETQEIRRTPAGVEAVPGSDRLRDFDAFARWVAARAAHSEAEADYLVEDPGGRLRQIVGKYTVFTDPEPPDGDGFRIRWFQFDTNGNVPWLAYNQGQVGLEGGGYLAFQNALKAWNNETATPIDYRYGGKTADHSGLTVEPNGLPDNLNTIVFNDPNNELPSFNCSTGGVLAYGGPWYFTNTRSFRGVPHHAVASADIVINSGIGCFFSGSPNAGLAAQELFGHELGHTLGLGHSCGDFDGPDPDCANPLFDEALMRAFVHDDARGARLNSDDQAGVRELYSQVPAAPTGLTAVPLSTTSIRLNWTDTATDEIEYQIEVKTLGGTFAHVLTVPANSTTADVTGLSPATSYTFRVRSRNANGFSSYSNEASAVTLGPVGPCVADATTLCLSNGRFKVQIAWKTATGNGVGTVVTNASDSGLFWFFDSNNWELLVKVLNGCSVNNRYWVFLAAVTDVEYTLTVIDSQTGSAKVYFHPQGQPAQSTTDTSAFATCP
jgi:Fibronectin type III domain